MSAGGNLDEVKLSQWLNGIGSDRIAPSAIKGAALGPLWSFLGFAQDTSVKDEKKETGNRVGMTLFPQNAASNKLRASKGNVDSLSSELNQLQKDADTVNLKVSMHTAYLCRLQRLRVLIQWQQQQIQGHTVKLEQILKNASEGGLWAEAAKQQNAQLRESLDRQVASRMDTKVVDSSKLDWSAAEAVTSEDDPSALSTVSLLRSDCSVLDACTEQMQEDLQLIRALHGDVDRAEDAQAILDQATSLRDSGVPDFEKLIHSSRQEHVKLFFDTQEAAHAQRETANKIAALHTSLHRLCGGSLVGEQRKALLMVMADVAGNNAAILSLTKQLEVYRQKEAQLKEALQGLVELQEATVDSRLCNVMLDGVIQELLSDGSALLSSWDLNTDQVRRLLEATSEHSVSLLAGQKRMAALIAAETALLPKMPGDSSHAEQASGFSYLSLDAQRRSLKQAVRKMATMGRMQLTLEESEALASINPAKKISYQYSDYAAEVSKEVQLLEESREDVLLAQERATGLVPGVLKAWWEQPAIDCAPWIMHEGKGARDILKQMRNLHAAASNRVAAES